MNAFVKGLSKLLPHVKYWMKYFFETTDLKFHSWKCEFEFSIDGRWRLISEKNSNEPKKMAALNIF